MIGFEYSTIQGCKDVGIKLIHWQLKEVMDDHGIRATDLAAAIGVSKNAVSNWRSPVMPAIGGERFNTLVLELNRLRRSDSELIQPSDLIEFSLNPEELKLLGIG